MVRTQISLPEDLHRRVTEEARERGQSMSALIRGLLERELQPRNDVALLAEAARRSTIRSGVTDLSTNHDFYLNEGDRW